MDLVLPCGAAANGNQSGKRIDFAMILPNKKLQDTALR